MHTRLMALCSVCDQVCLMHVTPSPLTFSLLTACADRHTHACTCTLTHMQYLGCTYTDTHKLQPSHCSAHKTVVEHNICIMVRVYETSLSLPPYLPPPLSLSSLLSYTYLTTVSIRCHSVREVRVYVGTFPSVNQWRRPST